MTTKKQKRRRELVLVSTVETENSFRMHGVWIPRDAKAETCWEPAGAGESERTFVYVEDVCDITVESDAQAEALIAAIRTGLFERKAA